MGYRYRHSMNDARRMKVESCSSSKTPKTMSLESGSGMALERVLVITMAVESRTFSL